MAKRTADAIRNIAVVGHAGVGKTTFVDHVLHAVGVSNRAGDVDAGSSLSDYDPEEKERRFSIQSTIFHFESGDKHFNLIDTPGYLDFIGPAMGVLPAVETALIALSAREGIQLNTRRMWTAAEERGLARVLLITRIDGDGIDLPKLLGEIQEDFGSQCRPVFLPIGTGPGCSGVANVIKTEEAPDGVVGDFDSAREAALESVIESDDDLMERYLEGEEISAEEIAATIRRAVATGTLVPVLCCASKANVGVKETIEFLADCAPSPVERRTRTAAREGHEEVELAADPAGPFCAQVFQVSADVHVGKISYVRVVSGSLQGDLTVRLARTGKSERLGHIYLPVGEEHVETDTAVPGDILCLTKVDDLGRNDTLCGQDDRMTLPPGNVPAPMMSLAVTANSRDDDQKVAAGLQQFAEGDPSLRVERDRQSSELVITGMSILHLNVTLSRLKRRYGVDVQTHEPSTPYRETITKIAEDRYRHKKQTGGRGQFGEVFLRVEPNERGAGFEFVDEIVGGSIPRQFLPAIEKGIREVLVTGIIAGYPVVDIKAAAYDGSFHAVDSSEAAFKIAGARALRAAFAKANPVLLEPMAHMDVTIPAEYMGDVTGNLTGHRGRILGMDQIGPLQVIKAEIPMAEVARYNAELKSMTGGEGSFSLEFSHYDVVPTHIQQEIVARAAKAKEED